MSPRSLSIVRVAGALITLGLSIAVAPATAQTIDDHRFALAVNVGAQTTVRTRSDTIVFEQFVEPGRFTSIQELGRDLVLGGGVSRRVWKRVGVGLYASHFRTRSTAQVDADVPHPFFFEFPRNAEAQTELSRREWAVDLRVQYWMPVGDRWRLTAYLGPTLFQASQELVSAITTVERGFPFEAVDIRSVDRGKVSTSAFGYHAGLDFTFSDLGDVGFLGGSAVLGRLGLTAGVRFSRARPGFEFMGQRQPALKLGGTQATGGLLVLF